MSPDFTVSQLVDCHGERLGLAWIVGAGNSERQLCADGVPDRQLSLVGHLSLMRPNWVQVLGRSEAEHLDSLPTEQSTELVAQLMRGRPAAVIVADELSASLPLRQAADRHEIPLLTSTAPSETVVTELRHFLAKLLARRVTVHGVFLEVLGVGVLITGESGVGKSELALELVSRGAHLIADDAPDFSLIAPDVLEGTCPPPIKEFMEVRGLGIVNVRTLFGDSAIKPKKYLRLIIHLRRMDETEMRRAERFRGLQQERDVLGVLIPEVTLPVAPGRNLAVLAECTVRNYILRSKGYDPADDFELKQRQAMEEGEQ